MVHGRQGAVMAGWVVATATRRRCAGALVSCCRVVAGCGVGRVWDVVGGAGRGMGMARGGRLGVELCRWLAGGGSHMAPCLPEGCRLLRLTHVRRTPCKTALAWGCHARFGLSLSLCPPLLLQASRTPRWCPWRATWRGRWRGAWGTPSTGRRCSSDCRWGAGETNC